MIETCPEFGGVNNGHVRDHALRPTNEIDALDVIVDALEAHRPAADWHCACGADLFGGSAAYSWSLFKAHAAESIVTALRSQGD